MPVDITLRRRYDYAIESKGATAASRAERENEMEFSFYKGTAINKGGVMPYIDPCTATTYFTAAALANRVDNISELDRPGINHIVVSVLPDRWHIEQVGGYSYEDGLFTIVCA